jgi:cytidylate kinase
MRTSTTSSSGGSYVIVAIDGPAASGKSTVAKAVARRLGFRHLDTGAMYRAVAWLALERDVAPDDAAAVTALARECPVSFDYADGAVVHTAVFIDGHDVTTAVRLPAVDASVSAVASIPDVRTELVARQRALAASQDSVVEGRDIGTVVFPDAEVKVFLTASAEERARRRQIDLERAGHDVATGEVLERLNRRDHFDSTREASPTAQADDAELLDTTGLTVDEVVDRIVARVEAV